MSEIHRKFTELAEKKKELERQIEKVKQQRQDDSILRAHDSIVESALKRQAEYDARLQAAVQPEVDRQLAIQKAHYEERAARYEERAKEMQQMKARYAELAATERERNPDKDATIKKQQRKIDDQNRELKALRKQVSGYEAQQQHQKKRKRNREEERDRRLMFSTHPAVSTCTPESTSKRLSVRKSRTSALARIDNALATNIDK